MKNKIEYTKAENKILSMLCVGKENARTRKFLVLHTGYKDRYVRQTIHDLRKKGVNIISSSSSSGGGYWLSAGRVDDKTFYDEMNQRGKHCIGAVKEIRKGLKTSKNQESLFELD